MEFKPGDIVEFVKHFHNNDDNERWLGTRYKVLLQSPKTSLVQTVCIGPKFHPGYEEGTFAQFYPEQLKLVEENTVSEQMIPASKVREIAKKYADQYSWCGKTVEALKEMGIDVKEPHFVVTLEIPASYCSCNTKADQTECASAFLLGKMYTKPTSSNTKITSIDKFDWA